MQLSKQAQEVLLGQAKFELRKINVQKPGRQERRGKKERPEVADEDRQLLTALKALRLELARERKVPAFVIFADTTLHEMAQRRPSTPDQLLKITGVGRRKLEQFGDAFLEVVLAH